MAPTLEEMERLVAQLPAASQLKLAAGICERLSNASAVTARSPTVNPEELATFDAWLAECDAFVESQTERSQDVTEELRELREQRASRR